MRCFLYCLAMWLLLCSTAQADWQNCSTVTKAVGGVAGGLAGASLGEKLSSRFGGDDAKARSTARLLGGALGAATGAKAACAFTRKLSAADRGHVANANRTSLSSSGKAQEKWTNDDGNAVEYSAEARAVEVKEYAGSTCKAVDGQISVAASASEVNTADTSELYCQSAQGEWVAAEGTVI